MPNPIMPRILNFADRVTEPFYPGDWYNSRTDQFRPLGIAQGLTGIPVDTANELYNRFGGGIGEAFRSGGSMLSSLRDRFRTGRDSRTTRATANMPPVPWAGVAAATANMPPAPRPATVDSYSARSGGLGMGQLGRGSFANQLYYENAMRNRGGALMER